MGCVFACLAVMADGCERRRVAKVEPPDLVEDLSEEDLELINRVAKAAEMRLPAIKAEAYVGRDGLSYTSLRSSMTGSSIVNRLGNDDPLGDSFPDANDVTDAILWRRPGWPSGRLVGLAWLKDGSIRVFFATLPRLH